MQNSLGKWCLIGWKLLLLFPLASAPLRNTRWPTCPRTPQPDSDCSCSDSWSTARATPGFSSWSSKGSPCSVPFSSLLSPWLLHLSWRRKIRSEVIVTHRAGESLSSWWESPSLLLLLLDCWSLVQTALQQHGWCLQAGALELEPTVLNA